MKSKFILLILLICLLSISIVSGNEIEDNNQVSSISNNDIYVSTNGNDEWVGSVDQPYLSISKAVSSLSENTTIHIGEGTFTGENNSGISINKNNPGTGDICIIGAGIDKTIIDLKGKQFLSLSYVSETEITSLTIINLTVKNGGAFNAAVFSSGNLIIDNVKFLNNSATGNNGGGAVCGFAGTCTIKNSYFINNTANSGGAICSSKCELIVKNSYFINNTANSGGAISSGSTYSNTKANISNSIFKNSISTRDGGAISICKGDVINNTFEDCKSTSTSISYIGGAVAAQPANIINNTFINCKSASYGDAIGIKSGNCILMNNIIINKTAVICSNGMFNAYVDILNNQSNIIYNGAKVQFIATVTDDMGNLVTGGDVQFELNGTVYGKGTVVKGTVIAGLSQTPERGFYNVEVTKNYGMLSNDAVVKTASIYYNVTNKTGVVYVSVNGSDESGDGSKENPFKTIIKAFNTGFSKYNNLTIYISEGNYEGELNSGLNVNFECTLNIVGAGMDKTIIDADNIQFLVVGKNAVVYVNNLTIKRGYASIASYYGGAIYSEGKLYVDGCKFENSSGGSLAKRNPVYLSYNSFGYITNSLFLNNGAPIYCQSNANGYVDYCTFIDCSKFVANNIAVNNCIFENCTESGALSAKNIIENNTFINCHSKDYGGGLTLSGTSYLKNNTFINCSAVTAGNEIYLDSNGKVNGILTILDNSTISINSKNFYVTAVLTDDMGNLISSRPTGSANAWSISIKGTVLVKAYDPWGIIKGVCSIDLDEGVYPVSITSKFLNDGAIIKGGAINYTKSEPSLFEDIYVSENGSDLVGNGSLARPFATITEALNYAAVLNTLSANIHILGTLKGTGNNLISFTSPINLTFVGENKDSIIEVESVAYVLDISTATSNNSIGFYNLTFKDGVISSSLLKISAINSIIDGCSFVNITGGYAISAVLLNSSIIINNSVFKDGNGAFTNGGDALKIIISNCNFTNNSLNYNSKNYPIVKITTSMINPYYDDEYFTLSNCIFNNTKGLYLPSSGSIDDLAVVSVFGVNSTYDNCKFLNSNWTTLFFSGHSGETNKIWNCLFEDNIHDIQCYYSQTSTPSVILDIANTTFIKGGGFYGGAGKLSTNGYIVNSSFINMTEPITFHVKGYPNQGVYLTVEGTLFENSEITLSGPGSIVNSTFYNTIVKKLFGGASNLNYNYWDSITPNYIISDPDYSIICDYWLVPVISSNNASGPIQNITFGYMVFDGENYTYYDISKVPFLPTNVTFTTDAGTVLPNPAILSPGDSVEFMYDGEGYQNITGKLNNGLTANLTVNFKKDSSKLNMDLITKNVYLGDNAIIELNLTNEKGTAIDGVVEIYLKGILKQNVTVVNGSAIVELPIDSKVGINEIFASFVGNNYYGSSNATSIVTVKESLLNVSVENQGSVYDTIFNITLNHPANGTVTVTIDDKKYNASIKNGKGQVIIPPMKAGNYTAVVSYNEIVNKTVNYENTYIKSNTTEIVANNIELYYKNGTKLDAKLIDSEGNPIANVTVQISVNGGVYNRTTKANGSAIMSINLNPGVYNVSIVYKGNDILEGCSKNVNITVLSIVNAEDLVLYYRNGSKFVSTLLDGQGNPFANQSVQFNINGVIYNRTTKVNGSCGITINLSPGTYVITTMYGSFMYSNNITVLPTIIADNLVKFFHNDSRFDVKVVDKKGNAVAGKKVTFNINGVMYSRTTNENGTAKFSINLAPGEYIITSMCDDLMVSHTVSVLSTIISDNLEMTTSNRNAFVATVLDNQGNPIQGKPLSFNINGVIYNRTSDVNGSAKLNINLMAGEYIITTMYNGLMQSNTVTIRE